MISSTTSRSCGDRLSSTSRSVCVVGLAELRPLLVDNIDAGLNLLDVLDEGLGDVLTIGVISAMVAMRGEADLIGVLVAS